MRPLPETRSRRQSDPQLLANKRLTNGFTKEHMTTRSKAKNQVKSFKSKTKTSKARTIVSNSSSSSSPDSSPRKAFNHNTITSTSSKRKEPNNNNGGSNSFKNGNASVTTRRSGIVERGKLGDKVYKNANASSTTTSRYTSHIPNNIHHKNSSERGRYRTKAAVVTGKKTKKATTSAVAAALAAAAAAAEAAAAARTADKATKRRSALWVLNCEAESFLFGETAADKHEVELPPLSPPPKKRRRMRTNELGNLLKESPILESKLRKASSESGDSSPGPPRKKIKKKGRPRKLVEDGEESTEQELTSPPVPEPPDLDCYSQSVRIQNILNTMEWRFSFEDVPSTEVWYQTFSRQGKLPGTFVSPYRTPVVLPYETKSLYRRSPAKFSRLPRKSPRCHASTLAILSALKPPRSRSSISSATAPTLSASTPPLASTSTSALAPQHISTRSSSVASTSSPPPSSSVSVVQSGLSSKTLSPPISLNPNLNYNSTKNYEMTATQYLWDSIQFLSDPYVVQVLAGELPKKPTKSSGNTSNNNSCPMKNLTQRFEALERRASLRSESGGVGTVGVGVSGAGTVTGGTGIKLIPSPKVSPRNHIHGTNHNSSSNSHSKSENRSPATNSNSNISNAGNCRKSPRKSPVVLVSDIFKTKVKKVIYEEEVLFLGDGLPPLPSWPV